MRQYLFKELTVIKKWQVILACVGCIAEIISIIGLNIGIWYFIILLLIGLAIFGTGIIPILVNILYKNYYVEIIDDKLIRHGTMQAAVSKKVIELDKVMYLVRGNGEPITVLRGVSGTSLKNNCGTFLNAFDGQKKFLFTIRDEEIFLTELLKKCPNAQVVNDL